MANGEHCPLLYAWNKAYVMKRIDERLQDLQELRKDRSGVPIDWYWQHSFTAMPR